MFHIFFQYMLMAMRAGGDKFEMLPKLPYKKPHTHSVVVITRARVWATFFIQVEETQLF